MTQTFDGTPMTKREIRIARQAADSAINHAWPWISSVGRSPWIGSDAIKDRLYPLPKVTRPRVLKDRFGVDWRMAGNVLENRERDGREWRTTLAPTDCDGTSYLGTADRVKLWADLLARPNEEVEDV